MNIQPISQNNPNFGQFYAPKTLRQFPNICSQELLKEPEIKKCAEKFDIVVKQGKVLMKSPLFVVKPILAAKLGLFIGAIGGGISSFITNSPLSVLTVAGLGTTLAATLASLYKVPSKFKYDVYGRKQYSDGSEIKTNAVDLPIFSKYNLSYLKGHHFVQELETKDKQRFLKIIASKYPKDGVYDAKTILGILQSKEINDDYNNGEAFNYPIDINGNSSLLMKFFDLKKTHENAKEYDKIASIIKSTPNIDFNQQDKIGITIIENVLNSENTDALEIIKDVEFEYTPYLDTIFNNIKDENFKAKTKSLKINFNATKKALFEEKSMQKFQEAATCLDSPFCNSREKALEIWDMAQEQFGAESLKEINMILYKYLPEPMRIES